MPARVALSIALLLNLAVTRADMERALALARWPHTAEERTRFHDPYFVYTAPQGLGEFRTLVLQIEVITEFRRIELLGEEHQLINDSFGRAGTDEVIAAVRPWHRKLAIDVHLQLPVPDNPIPPVDIEISGVGRVSARQAARLVSYAKSSFPALWLQGNVVEGLFDADTVAREARDVRVIVDGRELARASVDFSTLE